MTKDEIIKAVHNHAGEVKAMIAALEYHLHVLASGYRLEVEGEIDSLKGMMDTVKDKAGEIKSILGGWPS